MMVTAGPAATRSSTWKRVRKSWPWYLFILPNVVGFVLFGAFPLIVMLVLSFDHWYLFSSPNFIGVKNFVSLAQDSDFLTAVRVTITYAILTVIPGAALALGLALLINQGRRGMTIFRVAFFIPVVTSITVIAFLWTWIYGPDTGGPLNYLLHSIGIGPQPWLQSTTLALPAICVFSIWSSAGYTMILWLSGLQTVPLELYDAAAVDGANRWQRFLHVTLPMLRPTTVFIVMIGTINALQMFGPAYLMTGGGPASATESVVYWIWNTAFQLFDMGRAATGTTILFVIIMAIALLQRRFLGWGDELY